MQYFSFTLVTRRDVGLRYELIWLGYEILASTCLKTQQTHSCSRKLLGLDATGCHGHKTPCPWQHRVREVHRRVWVSSGETKSWKCLTAAHRQRMTSFLSGACRRKVDFFLNQPSCPSILSHLVSLLSETMFLLPAHHLCLALYLHPPSSTLRLM